MAGGQKRSDKNTGFEWLEPPGIYVDWFSASVFKNGIVRISFCEYLDRETVPFFRTGLAMPVKDAKRLVSRLIALIEEFEEPEEDKNSGEAPAHEE